MMNVVHIFFKQNSMGENFLMLGRVLYHWLIINVPWGRISHFAITKAKNTMTMHMAHFIANLNCR